MESPIYVQLVFGLSVLLAFILFYKATNRSKVALMVLFAWLVLQSVISVAGFYTVTDTVPPRFPLLVLPMVLLIIGLFLTQKGRQFIDQLDVKYLTLLHIIRVPIELVLFWLFLQQMIPELMTFEGRNYDIFSGISAPFIYYFGFVKKVLPRNIIIIWNFICLALVFNIVFYGILSAPGVLQQFSFEQPNIAVLYFPFALLPAVLVPLVILAHLASIRLLLQKQPAKTKTQSVYS